MKHKVCPVSRDEVKANPQHFGAHNLKLKGPLLNKLSTFLFPFFLSKEPITLQLPLLRHRRASQSGWAHGWPISEPGRGLCPPSLVPRKQNALNNEANQLLTEKGN